MSIRLTAAAGDHELSLTLGVQKALSSAGIFARRMTALVCALCPWFVVFLHPELWLGEALALVILVLVPMVAVALVVIPEISISRSPNSRSWGRDIQVRVSVLEWLVLGAALAFVMPFVAHLFADGSACARGIHSAC